MLLKIDKPLASVNWLMQHINNENLIVLDATLPKVTAKQNDISEKKMQIKNALFFDIK
jgi:thiosulfate/3-mercaptopyruvate sulfurtransferase